MDSASLLESTTQEQPSTDSTDLEAEEFLLLLNDIAEMFIHYAEHLAPTIEIQIAAVEASDAVLALKDVILND